MIKKHSDRGEVLLSGLSLTRVMLDVGTDGERLNLLKSQIASLTPIKKLRHSLSIGRSGIWIADSGDKEFKKSFCSRGPACQMIFGSRSNPLSASCLGW